LLLKVRQSGRSAIAATAQYDAINQLVRLQRWSQAQSELADFRQHYPDHKLTPSLAAKAVAIYQGMDMPEAAAGELMTLANSDPNAEVRRSSLYLAAEQFEQAGNHPKAIDAYRQYTRQW